MITGGGTVTWAITTNKISWPRVEVILTCIPEDVDLKKITLIASFDSAAKLQDFIWRLQESKEHVWKDLGADPL